MSSHVSQLDIRNLPNVEGNECMPPAVQDQLLSALDFNPSPIPQTCHLLDEAVLCIRLPMLVEENVVAGFVGLPSQSAAHSQDSGRHRDCPRPGDTLPSNGLVLWNDPEFILHIGPSPQQRPHSPGRQPVDSKASRNRRKLRSACFRRAANSSRVITRSRQRAAGFLYLGTG